MSQTMQRRDRIIPWYFVMFFAVIALVNGVMIHLALKTHTGTVTEHPYEKGLAYNQVVAAEAKQESLGWNGAISYSKGLLHFSLYDKAKRQLVPQDAKAIITRPTQSGMDFTVMLKGENTPVHFPAPGIWDVRVEAVASGQHYQQVKRVVIE